MKRRTQAEIWQDDRSALEELESGMLPTSHFEKETVRDLSKRGHITCFRRRDDPSCPGRAEWWMQLTPTGQTYLQWLKV